MGEILIDHRAPPDPYGVATLSDQTRVLADTESNVDNTLAPPLSATFRDVALDETVAVQIRLDDEDDFLSGSDDYIGTVIIRYDDVVAAYEDGGAYQVATHDQGTGAILFIGVSVMTL